MQPVWGCFVHLDYAKGRVPIPAGTITASWIKNSANNTFTVELWVPLGTEAVLKFPRGENGETPTYQGADSTPEGSVTFTGAASVRVTVSY